MSSLDRQLADIGLTHMQARMYVALLQLGEATAGQLAKQSNINRVTAYTTLEELETLGIATHDDHDLIRIFHPAPLESIEAVFMTRAKSAIESYRQVQSILPELKAISHKRIFSPQTTYSEGTAAAKKYLGRISDKHLLIGTYIADANHYDLLKPIVKKAAEANVRPQAIIPNSIKADLLVYLDHRVVPDRISQFPSTMLFFADRVVWLFQNGDLLQLFAVEDERVSGQQHSIFTLNWRILSGHHLIMPMAE